MGRKFRQGETLNDCNLQGRNYGADVLLPHMLKFRSTEHKVFFKSDGVDVWLVFFTLCGVIAMCKSVERQVIVTIFRCWRMMFIKHLPVCNCNRGVARGPEGPCPPQSFGRYSHFVLWEPISQRKWRYSPKIKHSPQTCCSPPTF